MITVSSQPTEPAAKHTANDSSPRMVKDCCAWRQSSFRSIFVAVAKCLLKGQSGRDLHRPHVPLRPLCVHRESATIYRVACDSVRSGERKGPSPALVGAPSEHFEVRAALLVATPTGPVDPPLLDRVLAALAQRAVEVGSRLQPGRFGAASPADIEPL
jgi:hypothetical protein